MSLTLCSVLSDSHWQSQFTAVFAAKEAYTQLFWLKYDGKAFLGFYIKVTVLNSLMAITDRLLTWMIFPSFIVLEGPSGKRKKKKHLILFQLTELEKWKLLKIQMALDWFIRVFLQVKLLRCLPISLQVWNGPLYHPSHLLATHVLYLKRKKKLSNYFIIIKKEQLFCTK